MWQGDAEPAPFFLVGGRMTEHVHTELVDGCCQECHTDLLHYSHRMGCSQRTTTKHLAQRLGDGPYSEVPPADVGAGEEG